MASVDADLDPTSLENMRRMAYDRSKWLQTATYTLAKYQYNKEELNQFYDELSDVIGRIKSSYVCQMCNTFPKKSFILPCGHLFCAKCASRSWNKPEKSKCPHCKFVHEEGAISFFAMDYVFTEMAAFSKESKVFQNPNYKWNDESKEATKRLKSWNFALLQRLKNLESQLMCDFCFNRIKKTYLVNCSSEAFTFRPFCKGCDGKYITFYEKEQGRRLRDSIEFSTLDPVVSEFSEFLDKMMDYSKQAKVPVRFTSSNQTFSYTPIYKILVGFAVIGLVFLYLSSS